MKTIEIESIEKITSLDLSYVIFFWREYDPNSVLIAYAELIKREYPISGNFFDKMTEFRKINLLQASREKYPELE
jgi:hypothetical protein